MRVNFFGGPSAGKSTTAAWLFSQLKEKQVSVELVNEYVKQWSYQNRKINEFDQTYIFGKQLHYEYRYLTCGVKNTITDSPVLLSAIYANLYWEKLDLGQQIEQISDKYDEKFPAINIFLNRKDKPYVKEGRYQNYEQAKEIDAVISSKLNNKYKIGENLFYIDYSDREAILDTVLKYVQ